MRTKSLEKGHVLIIAAVVAALALVCAAVAYVVEPWAADAHKANVPAKTALADYSWDELAAISAEVGACADQDEAVRAAARYGLVNADGTMPVSKVLSAAQARASDPVAEESSAVKEVTLSDGCVMRVGIVGIWHDARTDGGQAGLTFAFLDAVGQHAMNHAFEDADGEDADSVGGWQASDMRTWLNGPFLYDLPSDLRSHIVAVQKQTASRVDASAELDEAGRLAGSPEDWVESASDKVWLFSVAELCASVPARDDMGVDATMRPVYAAEGSQYRAFADAGVQAFAPNDALVRADAQQGEAGKVAPCTWWLRTKTLEFGSGFWLVGTDGTPLNGLGEDARVVEDPYYAPDELWGPDHARGVIAGFCI